MSFPNRLLFASFDAHWQNAHVRNNADATVLVALDGGQHDSRRGSGVVLPYDVLLTCLHVLPTATNAATAAVSFRYHRHGDARGAGSLQPDRLFITNPELDYTLVAISPLPLRLAAVVLPICPPAWTEAKVEKGTYPLGHPEGVLLRINLAGRRMVVDDLHGKTRVVLRSDRQGPLGGGVYDSRTGALVALITPTVRTTASAPWRLPSGETQCTIRGTGEGASAVRRPRGSCTSHLRIR